MALLPPNLRRRLGHGAAILAITLVALWLFDNAAENLAKNNIKTGFAFLGSRSNFDIEIALIPYSDSASYGRAFIVGVLNTLMLAGVSIAVASGLGLAIGVAQLSRNELLALIGRGFVEAVRNVPLLLHLFVWYFVLVRSLPAPRESYSVLDLVFLNNRGLSLPWPLGGGALSICGAAAILLLGAAIAVWRRHRQRIDTGLAVVAYWSVAAMAATVVAPIVLLVFVVESAWSVPRLDGFNLTGGLTILPELLAMIGALSVYAAAPVAEIVRAGVLAVSRHQVEVGRALGLSSHLTMRLVVLPIALRSIVLPLGNQYLHLLRNTSLGAAIAMPELMHVFAGTALNQTGQAFETIGMTMLVYLVISLAVAWLSGVWNNRVMSHMAMDR